MSCACSDQCDPPASTGADATVFSVRGLNCQSCVRKATAALEAVPGIASAVVSLEQSRATVRWRTEAAPSSDAVVHALQTAGFEAEPIHPSSFILHPSPWSPLSGWQFNVVFGGAVTLLLMVGEWAFGLGMERWFQWTAFALALPVQAVCGARFYVGAWRQLKVGSSNM
ncbi:MAG: cation transporter, partial [Limisphaerales bacterium]